MEEDESGDEEGGGEWQEQHRGDESEEIEQVEQVEQVECVSVEAEREQLKEKDGALLKEILIVDRVVP